MNSFEDFLSLLDYALDTKRKRHMIGGILMSVSLLFGGLAVTALSIKMEDESNGR